MIVVKTPLWLSFVGGGSDIKDFYSRRDGKVISSSIDKFIYVIVKERFDDEIHVNYTKKEIVNEIDEIQHDLVREAMRMAGIRNGIDIVTMADIPSQGSGLGSSSAVTVALLHACYTYQKKIISAKQLAEDACQIEIDILKRPIGKQDQYSVSHGGFHEYIFRSDGTTEVVPVEISLDKLQKFSSSLLLYYTGITRDANKILAEQIKNYSIKEKFDNVCEISELVESFKNSLKTGDIENCGWLLNRNWELKKNMAAGVTNEEVDFMYQKAIKAGAIGGKIAGAGGGGFLLLSVPMKKQSAVMEVMKNYRQFPFVLEHSGSQVIMGHQGDETEEDLAISRLGTLVLDRL